MSTIKRDCKNHKIVDEDCICAYCKHSEKPVLEEPCIYCDTDRFEGRKMKDLHYKGGNMKILFWLKENAILLFIIAALLLVYFLTGCKNPAEAKPVQAEIMTLDDREFVVIDGEIYPVKYQNDTHVWYDCDSSWWIETWYADTCWPDSCPYRYDTLILHFSNCKELEL